MTGWLVFRKRLTHFVKTPSLFDYIKAEKCPRPVNFVSSSDTSDGWADKNRKYWSDYFINLLLGLLVLCGPEVSG